MTPTDKEKCPKFQTCSAALCPLDFQPGRYWYADTEICSRRGDVPRFVRIQKKIQKTNPERKGYFTQKMLESITRVTADLTGIEYNGYSATKEREWLHARKDRHKERIIDSMESVAS